MTSTPTRRRSAIWAAAALLAILRAASPAAAAEIVSPEEAGQAPGFVVGNAHGSKGPLACCAAPDQPAKPAGALDGVAVRVGGPAELTAELAEFLLGAGATVEALDPIGFQPSEVVVADGDPTVEVYGDWLEPIPGQRTGWVRFAAHLPASGLYPVYVRAGDASNPLYSQEYLIVHSAGETLRLVNHRAAGDGWIYLGAFHFSAWSYIEVTNRANLDDAGEPVIPAAVRFGNGVSADPIFSARSGAVYQNEFAERVVNSINSRLMDMDPQWINAASSATSGGVVEVGGRDRAELIFRDPLTNGSSLNAFEAREAIARAAGDALLSVVTERAGDETVVLPPSRPSGLVLKNDARGRRVLAWAAPAEGDAPTGYVVQVSRDGRGYSDGKTVDASASPEADITGLIGPNETRYLRVAAFNKAGLSLPSESVSDYLFAPGGDVPRGPSGPMCSVTGDPDIAVDPTNLIAPGAPRPGRASAPAHRATLDACAFYGDVNEIDLTVLGGNNFSIASGPSNGIIAQIDNYASVLASGKIYYAPNIPDNGEAGVPASGTDTITVNSSTGSHTVNVNISKGYTNNAPGAASNKLNTYRLQQRLKYFGFLGSNALPLAVDGAAGGNTNWAIGVFNTACADANTHASSSSLTGAGTSFINAGNAPRWRENGSGGTGWTNIDTAADNQDWGTSWAMEVIEAAGAANSSGSNIQTNDLSLKKGGNTPDHASHEGGMDIDVDTPALENNATSSFYAVHSNGQVQASNGGSITNGVLVWNGSTYVVSAFGTTGALTATGTHNNSTVLGRPGFATGIKDNTAVGYDITSVRAKLQAFANVTNTTPSGASTKSIYYNDPRTWGQGWSAPVSFSSNHNGHFHVNIGVPTPTAIGSTGGGGGGGTGNVTVQVANADIATNTILVALSPTTSSGSLTLKLDNHTIYTGTHSGGNVSLTFGDINALPDGQEYQNIVATWNVGGQNYTGQRPYHIKVLGTYRHSQYNIPAESHATCATGGTVNIYITNASCVFTAATFPGTFRSQTALNGRGTSISYGIAVTEQFCLSHANNPGATFGYAFRRNGTASGACGTVTGTTVAANQNHPDLECNDRIYIHSGATGVVKTVTDYCPACGPPTRSDYKQLDNFTTDGRCSGISDFGNFKTIKLF
jgi:hypothetical protein